MLSFKYVSSKGETFDFMTFAHMITECNAFNYAFTPVTFGKKYGTKIYGFEMAQKEIDGTFYVFGNNRVDYINHLFAALDLDVENETPGKLICNGYEIECFSIEASDATVNRSSLLWDSFKRKFICPYPFWSRQSYQHTFNDTDEPIVFNNIKDYMPVSSEGTADYPYDLMTIVEKKSSFVNTDLTGSQYQLIISGTAVDPVITLGDVVIALNLTILEGQTITIDSRTKTVVLTNPNGTEQNRYGYRDVSVDIFKKVPYGEIPITWDGDYAIQLTLFDERTAPLWN